MFPISSISRLRRGAPLVLCCLFAVTGCGNDQTAEVSGRIKVNGKAPQMQGLMITFMSPKGEVVAAEVAMDGRYSAEDVPVGEIRVGFSIAGTGEAPKKQRTAENLDPRAEAKRLSQIRNEARSQRAPTRLPFPTRFLDPLKSGLIFTVQSGKANTYNPEVR